MLGAHSVHTRGVSCLASPSNTRRSEKSTRRLASKAASSTRACASAYMQADASSTADYTFWAIKWVAVSRKPMQTLRDKV